MAILKAVPFPAKNESVSSMVMGFREIKQVCINIRNGVKILD